MIAAVVIQVRKVRASQGRMPDNVRWRRLQGQCNRNKLPFIGKRWKGSVRDYRPDGNGRGTCKPHPKQDQTENHTVARRVLR